MQIPSAATLATEDSSHLRLLSIFHYVVAGLTGVFSLFPLIHLLLGIAMVSGTLPASPGSDAAEQMLAGWFFIAIAAIFITLGLSLAALIAFAGRCLGQQRRHLFCTVIAGLSCMIMPFGTVLGVFTLIVLMRPQVKAAFAS